MVSESRPEIADYILNYRNTRLAVLEAKRWDLPYTEGAAQAKEYAKKLGVRFGFATNGQAIYEMDVVEGTERDIASFPTPDELWERTFAVQNAWRDRFAAVPLETKGGTWGDRYYQDIAIGNVLEAVAAADMRILLTMATGTGKTGIAAQIAWKLFKSRWNLQRRANPPAPGPVPGRPQHPCRPGVQRVLVLPRGRPR